MTNDFYALLKRITDKGLEIKVAYDIGAFVGDWTVKTREVLPRAEFIMFEANPACIDYLKKVKAAFFCGKALSSPDTKTVQFFNSNNGNSSYYRDTMKVYDDEPATEFECITVDEIMHQYNIPTPNLVKLDTQGSELDILKGASVILNNTELLLIECPILTANYGAPTFTDYIQFLKQYKYIPIDIVQKHIGEDILLQVDILFMKESAKVKYLSSHVVFRAFE